MGGTSQARFGKAKKKPNIQDVFEPRATLSELRSARVVVLFLGPDACSGPYLIGCSYRKQRQTGTISLNPQPNPAQSQGSAFRPQRLSPRRIPLAPLVFVRSRRSIISSHKPSNRVLRPIFNYSNSQPL